MRFFLSLFIAIIILLKSIIAHPADSFKPVIKCRDENCLHVRLTFSYKSNFYLYNLIRNEDLFNRDYKKTSTSNQYYIDDTGTPFTAIRIGNSREGIQGAISVDGKLRAIAFDNITGLHYFEAETESRMQTQFIDDTLEAPTWIKDFYSSGRESSDGPEPFSVKLTITIDKSTLRKWFDDDEDKVEELASTLANIANRLFEGVNVRLTLINFFVLEDDIKASSTPFNYFHEYEKIMSALPSVDGHHLYHGLAACSETCVDGVGWSTVGGVCIPGHNCGVSSVTHDSRKLVPLAVMAKVMAHEIGHSLFLYHDTDVAGCTCDAPNNECIMTPYKNNATAWSSCSNQVLRSLAKDIGNDPKNCPGDATPQPESKPNNVYIYLAIALIAIIVIILIVICMCFYKNRTKSNGRLSKAEGFDNPAKQSSLESIGIHYLYSTDNALNQLPVAASTPENFQSELNHDSTNNNYYNAPTSFVTPVYEKPIIRELLDIQMNDEYESSTQNPQNVQNTSEEHDLSVQPAPEPKTNI